MISSLSLSTLSDHTYDFPLPQNDGSAGLFQPLDDILDEAAPKIVRAVNGGPSDDAPAFPPISQEDMLSLTRYDCVINALKIICDFQSAWHAVSSGETVLLT